MLIVEVCGAPLEHQEAVVLRHLMDRGIANRDQLVDALYGHREDGGPLTAPKLVDFYVYRIRRWLNPGWTLQRVGPSCWQLRRD